METSRCFVATLPDMNDEQFEKLYAWSSKYCERRVFVKVSEHGCVRLLVVRGDPRTQRDFQRLLRTTLHNYGVTMSAKQVGRLRIFDECEYDKMKAIAGGFAVPEEEYTMNAEDDSRNNNSSADASSPSGLAIPPAPQEDQFATLLRLHVNLLTVK